MSNKLYQLLEIHKGITAIIGGGGKTTLLMNLAKELAQEASVIIATSTKIFKPDYCDTLLNVTTEEISEALHKKSLLCVASLHESGKLAVPQMSFTELSKLADYVLVEADGSKQLPIKAHATYEPVIPEETVQVIYVIGMDGIGKKLVDACHRPEIFADLVGCELDEKLTPELVAKAIRREALADRFYINKVSSENDWQNAKELSVLLDKPVLAGDLVKGEFRCLF